MSKNTNNSSDPILNFARGAAAEAIVAELLRRQGWTVTRTGAEAKLATRKGRKGNEFVGEPKVFYPFHAPDFSVKRRREQYWVEVKYTGLDDSKDRWKEAEKEIQGFLKRDKSGSPAYIVMIKRDKNGQLFFNQKKLSNDADPTGENVPGGMIIDIYNEKKGGENELRQDMRDVIKKISCIFSDPKDA